MNGLRMRYTIGNMGLKVTNVTVPERESYVLLTAFDNSDNEIVIELTHEQAEYLEDRFHEANIRWERKLSNDVTGRTGTDDIYYPPTVQRPNFTDQTI